MSYQRNDGSFSAFGQRDYSGSMWLTAFVAKSFQKARSFIYVDERTIYRAVDWMISRQNSDGSFPEPGRVLNRGLMVSSVHSSYGSHLLYQLVLSLMLHSGLSIDDAAMFDLFVMNIIVE